jgi:transposase
MSSPYDYDLRSKAISAVKRGEGKTAVSRMFTISRNTLDLWLKREKETGDYQALSSAPKRDRHKIKDWQKFREFIQQHGDKTQAQLAKLWGENVTQQNISDGLRKIGFSRKKKLTVTENEMR